MKKLSLTLIFVLVLSTVCTLLVAAAQLKINVDFSVMDSTESLTADDVGAYRVENVKIAEFNAEGNILVAKNNGAPSYLVYKISADEGKTLSALTVKSYASVNDFEVEGAPLAGNQFGIYVNTVDEFDVKTDTPIDGASGMVGKKNHTWKLDKYVEGKNEVYVCIYFLNNSSFVDWVRFYSFDFSATEKINAPETTLPDTESTPATTTPSESDSKIDTTAPDGSNNVSDNNTSGAASVPSESDSNINVDGGKTDIIPIILIVAAAIIAVIVIVAIIKVAKPSKKD